MLTGIVHFFSIFTYAQYINLSKEFSEVKDPFDLVYLPAMRYSPSNPSNPSNAFMVDIFKHASTKCLIFTTHYDIIQQLMTFSFTGSTDSSLDVVCDDTVAAGNF